VFSDLGPGNTYHNGFGYDVGSSQNSTEAFTFTPGNSYTLTQIDLGLGWIAPSTAQVTVELRDDNSGIPGMVIESWSVSNLPQFGSTNDIVQTVTPIGAVALVSGQQYWLRLSSSDEAAWNANSQNVTGTRYLTTNSFTLKDTVDMGAFDVLGDVVATPEPSYVVLLALGLGFFWVVVRRHKIATEER